MAPDRIFDRNGRVNAAGTIDVDVFGAEAAKRVREEVFHGDGPCVDAQPCARGIA